MTRRKKFALGIFITVILAAFAIYAAFSWRNDKENKELPPVNLSSPEKAVETYFNYASIGEIEPSRDFITPEFREYLEKNSSKSTLGPLKAEVYYRDSKIKITGSILIYENQQWLRTAISRANGESEEAWFFLKNIGGKWLVDDIVAVELDTPRKTAEAYVDLLERGKLESLLLCMTPSLQKTYTKQVLNSKSSRAGMLEEIRTGYYEIESIEQNEKSAAVTLKITDKAEPSIVSRNKAFVVFGDDKRWLIEKIDLIK